MTTATSVSTARGTTGDASRSGRKMEGDGRTGKICSIETAELLLYIRQCGVESSRRAAAALPVSLLVYSLFCLLSIPLRLSAVSRPISSTVLQFLLLLFPRTWACRSIVSPSSSFSSPFLSPPLRSLSPFFFLSLLLLGPAATEVFFLPAGGLSVRNPFLADGVWPIAHHDNYAQASTSSPGPLSAGPVDSLFHPEVAGALTVLYTPDGKAVWGSSLTSVFKVDRSSSKLRLIDSIRKDEGQRMRDTFRGIYSVLTREGLFYISNGNVISAYGDEEYGNSLSGIRHLRDYDFSEFAKAKERVLALNLSYDGFIVFCTSLGGVGVISRDLKNLVGFQYATAQDGEAPPVSVSNSISIDEFGGIYVVTSRYMHRMWWNAEDQVLHSEPPPATNTTASSFAEVVNGSSWREACQKPAERRCQVWSTPYPVESEPIVGRPTKEGSGTTPSLLKDELTGKLYVMIADGQRRQEVMAIDGESGEIVSRAAVDFNNGNEESYTEQSILVSGSRLLVTQNALTASGQMINNFLHKVGAERIVRGFDVPEFVQENVFLLPVLLGDSPRGFQQFELDSAVDPPQLRTTWTRNDLGCPNAIPTMSADSNVMYCVGKWNTPMSDIFLHSMKARWTIEAFRWDDGQTVFRKALGNTLLYNSLYAATQIGVDREVIYGCLGGLVRLHADEHSGRATPGVLGTALAVFGKTRSMSSWKRGHRCFSNRLQAEKEKTLPAAVGSEEWTGRGEQEVKKGRTKRQEKAELREER